MSNFSIIIQKIYSNIKYCLDEIYPENKVYYNKNIKKNKSKYKNKKYFPFF